MFLYVKQLANRLSNVKIYLVLSNVFLVFFLILFNNIGVFTVSTGDFIFFAFLFLIFALFRPGWAFLFFLGTIAMENINLAPQNFGPIFRPYQFIGGLLMLAIIINYFSQRLQFKLVKLSWLDYLIFFIPLANFLNIFHSQDPAINFKLTLILSSFAGLYLLTKNYLQNIFDLKNCLPFFFGSALIIVLYGFWQNIRFAKGLSTFTIMPGRPNSTFTEPDWLGLFIILVLAGIYTLIYFFSYSLLKKEQLNKKISLYFLYIFLIPIFALLVISVSRSAWLGASVMTILFLFLILTNLKFNLRNWQWKTTLKIKLGIISAFIFSLGFIYFFHLTTFQLFNRITSIGTGKQKITISCQRNIILPENISSLEELAFFDCRHIKLEEIESEKNQGKFIKEIFRSDPNINIRSQVYQRSFKELTAHPILGIGWENISKVLGKDTRGANLNSSNIFLETYLGSGLIGFLSLIIFLSIIFLQALRVFFEEIDMEKKSFALFILISWIGIIIFNLFNAGIMLGFFWVWLGIASNLNKKFQ